jgi:hypothetical protein
MRSAPNAALVIEAAGARGAVEAGVFQMPPLRDARGRLLDRCTYQGKSQGYVFC